MEETNLKEKETEEKMKNTDGNNKEIKVKESNKKKKNNNIGCYNFDYTCCYISFIYGICYYEY